ncbi:MAG: amino acid adenylation domain-containing protein [Moorea sp. SIOASIH]|uniref:non-ribosomal peptide synthetase n=1 Tax=Moorena sp. SIOASIH TaxID=2607817 RepID=UPI0013B6323D|nr:amino acid adenylation domain-containing protein [Moorena sp. SIOASIH]NEO40921.1 amino acid adenylation domain-containing protein [Moorena sp. SIOASIH]
MSRIESLPSEKAEKDFYPLSCGQQALWFINKLAPQIWAYNVLFAVLIRSEINLNAWQTAVRAIIDRHPNLKTTYTERNSQTFRVVNKKVEIPFQQIHASHWTDQQLDHHLTQSAHIPFNLEQELPIRVLLFTRSQTEHVLLLVIHQIAIDFRSMEVLLKELSLVYKGTRDSLPPIKVSYQDFIDYQNKMLASAQRKSLESYWRQQLAGKLPVLNLPTDRPRPSVQTYNGSSHYFQLTQELSTQLKKLAQDYSVTLDSLLLAAFQVLIYRLSGQEDILVGTPTSLRNQPEFSQVVGYFINLVVIRGNLSGNPTFGEFLTQLHQTALEAFAHQDYPFGFLVEQLKPQRDASLSPLLQVVFSLEKFQSSEVVAQLLSQQLAGEETGGQVTWGGLDVEPWKIPQQEGEFDLILEMVETKSSLAGVFKYNTDLFDFDTVVRIESCFLHLLKGIVTEPEKPVYLLAILTETQQHQLLVEWNQTRTQYTPQTCINQLFEKQVERTADAVAVVFETQQLTYRELNSRINQLAHYLRSLGVKPETLVGICVERSIEMVVGVLGILKAGGAYVPLDPVYPQERLAYMLEDAQVSLLLTQQQLLERLPLSAKKVVCLDSDWKEITTFSEKNPVHQVQPDNLAYLIYTSGSTGKPKGVLVTHQGLSNLVPAFIDILDMQPECCVLQFTSLSFDHSIAEIAMALCSGARLGLATTESLRPGSDLIETLQKQEVTHISLTPSILATLADAELPSLRTMFVGAEDCPPALAKQWSRRVQLFNTYGPTESTVTVTYAQCGGCDRKPPIGRPLPNIQLYILDDHLQPVPIGIPGQLHIGGIGLARGYLNRPELTAEKFIPNPFRDESGSRLYKTGDLVRYLPDGNIEFLGRIDNQVKVRGYRIELGEIEAVLGEHQNVRQALVIVREDIEGDKRLVAYVVPQQQELTVCELRSFLNTQLPNHMIPAAIIILEAIPLTPNGKIDRRALPAPDASRWGSEANFIAPRDALEKQLAQIWSEVLGVSSVGVQDNFFDLGGHSLLGVRLIARIQEQLGKKLPLATIFKHQTIEQLARLFK